MAAHVTAASVHDFKLFSYFFALFLLFLDIDACDFKSFDFYLSHFIVNNKTKTCTQYLLKKKTKKKTLSY
jgi:uncharacterized membrane protein